MNNIVRLLTTTEGRIPRKHWWLGFGVLMLASIVISMVLALAGLGVWPSMEDLQSGDPETVGAAVAASRRSLAWGNLVTFAILVYPAYALGVKRRHDRDKSGFDLAAFYGLTIVLMLLQALGIGYTDQPIPELAGARMPVPRPFVAALGLVGGIMSIYIFVVLGFLRGTAGANRYGPDPLGTPPVG